MDVYEIDLMIILVCICVCKSLELFVGYLDAICQNISAVSNRQSVNSGQIIVLNLQVNSTSASDPASRACHFTTLVAHNFFLPCFTLL